MMIMMRTSLIGLMLVVAATAAITKEDDGDVVFLGTIGKIEASPLPNSIDNWIVHCRVDKIVFGEFNCQTFSFRVHSPARSGLEVGKRYTIKAKRTAEGFTVDQNQWLKKSFPAR